MVTYKLYVLGISYNSPELYCGAKHALALTTIQVVDGIMFHNGQLRI